MLACKAGSGTELQFCGSHVVIRRNTGSWVDQVFRNHLRLVFQLSLLGWHLTVCRGISLMVLSQYTVSENEMSLS